jgi:hypothetical protein
MRHLIFVFYNVPIWTENAVSHEFECLTDCFSKKKFFGIKAGIFLSWPVKPLHTYCRLAVNIVLHSNVLAMADFEICLFILEKFGCF